MKHKIISYTLNTLLILIGYLWIKIALTIALRHVLPLYPGLMIVTLLSIALAYLGVQLSAEQWKPSWKKQLLALAILISPYIALLIKYQGNL